MSLDLVDGLSLTPTSHVIELEPPKYASSYGRRTEAVFKHAHPAPMVLTPDAGLVLYERVISNKQEHDLVEKLSAPRYYRPPAEKVEHASTSGRNPSAPSQRIKSGRDASAQGATSGGTAGASGTASRPLGASRSAMSSPAMRRAASERAQQQNSPDALKSYFQKERSSVTASQIFTWGNRYKMGSTYTGRVVGAGGGSSSSGEPQMFKSFTPAQQKPPLRL